MTPTPERPAPDVLILDDEPPVLKAIARALASEMDLALEATADPCHAVEVLATRPPRVLVTDYSMPRMNGVQVLEEARRVAPDTVRILVTGHADRANIIDAINAGRIFRFLPKPWDREALVAAVREALDAHASILRGRRVENAVEHAGDVQRSLLPSGRLRLRGAEAACSTTPHEYATGDYVDVFAVAGGGTALLLGDVCGHGIGAALFMFTARALLRSGLVEGGGLADVVERTNRFLCRDMNAGRFMTLFAAVHDASQGTLAWLNAGHTAPLLLSGDRIRELPRTGVPLGLLEEARYGSMETTPFLPGDTLFACTDGVTEARGDHGELFGPARLVALLREAAGRSPGEIVDHVRRATDAFVGARGMDDDAALLAYRVVASAVPA
jgi:sigma-B regulation protein RsbU (phosphoserine phosphatase)